MNLTDFPIFLHKSVKLTSAKSSAIRDPANQMLLPETSYESKGVKMSKTTEEVIAVSLFDPQIIKSLKAETLLIGKPC